ncbi:MAG: site-specific DNA-methyltransferase [Paludibacteraceae bacterium]|nr:site-specific DNA-methyltransferase [Paludibacteraceae bacterium]
MTEIIWDGKYTNGKKTAPVRIALPFQTIETVNESVQERQRTLDFFSEGRPSDWRNHLIWGDKKYVLPSLLPEFAGKVNLIYIDPPFDTGANFSFTATVPDNPETNEDETVEFTKQPSMIEQKAYRDTWGKGLDSYLQWFYETTVLLRELLAENGSIYVHLDWHVGHYAKCILDEVFGYDNFRNEIIWYYPDYLQGNVTKGFPRKNDFIMWYSKSNFFKFERVTEKLEKPVMRNKVFWNKKTQRMDLVRDENGKIIYEEFTEKYCDTIWQIGQTAVTRPHSNEYIGYPTQKPEALLERIIKAGSNEGDLVLDCFCGSGTTAAVAEKLNRRWITCDLGRFAIHTTRKRLLSIPDVKPFVVQNLGKYERQQWISSEFENPEQRLSVETAYRNFILELYHAQPIKGYTWLHGVRQGRMVHIGSVETPVAMGDVRNMIQELWKMAGKEPAAVTNGIDVLGWDFAFELNETALQFAAENKVDLKFKKIPREVLEKKAVEQGDIKFFELAHLETDLKTEDKKVTLTLTDFIVPPDDVPEEVRQKITHWSQWIDYWAVDWNYRDDTFHNEWQAYRSKKNPKIELSTAKTYEHTGEYAIIVKVIDILGNDTTKQIKIRI